RPLHGGEELSGRAPAFQAGGRGFESRFPLQAISRSPRLCRGRRTSGVWGPFRGPMTIGHAHVAQSAERVLGKDEVSGSIPDMGSIALERIVAANGGQ